MITGSDTILAMVLGERVFLFMSAEKATLAGAVVLIATGVWVVF